MYRNNVNLDQRKQRPGILKRLAKKALRVLEWMHFREQGVLFADDIWGTASESLARKALAGLPEAQLTEEQRRQKADEIRRRPRIK